MVNLNFSPGDKVRLRLARNELDGRVLESPGSEKDTILLKLESGYNVGVNKENILGSRILKKFSSVDDEIEFGSVKAKAEGKSDNGLKNIGLVVTGGTIAAKLDPKTGGVKWLTEVNEFMKFYPELKEIVNVKKIEVPFMTSSEAMTSEHWKKIAKSVKEMVNDPEIEGVIVTHGTDFLHYTSAALSFMLKDLGKPVVLTYSQRSIDRASSDARLNLVCAAHMVLSDCAEVMLVGHGSENDDYCLAIRGTKVRKLHSSRRDAFKPVNDKPIAKVWADGKIEVMGDFRVRKKGKTELDDSYLDKVALVKFYPGQDASILDFYALKYKGIIIEASGLGHLPASEAGHSWITTIKKHIRNGFVVCVAAQTVFGRLNPMVYSNGRELVEAGVIFLEDMLAETALVKLGWVLGHHGWKVNAKEKMLEDVAGELNRKLGREDFV